MIRRRSLSWAVLAGVALGCGPYSVNRVAVSPDGRLALAIVPEAGYLFLPEPKRCDIVVTDVSGKSLERITRNGRHNSWAAFSPDGKALLYLSLVVEENRATDRDFVQTEHAVKEKRLMLYDLATRKSKVLCEVGGQRFYNWPEFSPDGKKVAFFTDDLFKVVSVPDGARVASWGRGNPDEDVPGPMSFRWTGNAHLLVAMYESSLGLSDIIVVQLATLNITGREPEMTSWSGEKFFGATWTVPWIDVRDGLAVVPLYDLRLPVAEDELGKPPLQLWLVSEDAIRRLTNDENHYYYSAISPDGRIVAAISRPARFGPIGDMDPKDVLAVEEKKHECNLILHGGDLVLIDIETGKISPIEDEKPIMYPFWISGSRLGFVRTDLEEERQSIEILDLENGRRYDMTGAIAPRLRRLFEGKAEP